MTDPLKQTAIDVAAIRARWEDATRKPWYVIEGTPGIYSRWDNKDVRILASVRPVWHENDNSANDESWRNLVFAANAHQDIPALLARVEELQLIAWALSHGWKCEIEPGFGGVWFHYWHSHEDSHTIKSAPDIPTLSPELRSILQKQRDASNG